MNVTGFDFKSEDINDVKSGLEGASRTLANNTRGAYHLELSPIDENSLAVDLIKDTKDRSYPDIDITDANIRVVWYTNPLSIDIANFTDFTNMIDGLNSALRNLEIEFESIKKYDTIL